MCIRDRHGNGGSIIAKDNYFFIDNSFVRYLVCFAVVMFIGIKVLPEFVKENRRKAE